MRSAIVIAGASGDLAHRKLIPALNYLFCKDMIDRETVIIGSGRGEISQDDFRSRFKTDCEFESRLYYHQGLEGIKDYLNQFGSFDRIICFLAIPPKAYSSTAAVLSKEGFGEETLLVIEKPFGNNLETATQLNRELTEHFKEEQIYRNDHYLAKETVQNIMVFRFANTIFEAIWNNRHVESIIIEGYEELGLEERAAYYDTAGSLRDMIQNHLMQLLCLVTMEPPVNLEPDEISRQKVDILKSLHIDSCRKGQYEGYRLEKGVDPDSATDTAAEIHGRIENFRWSGVPITLRTAKAASKTDTRIIVTFKNIPRLLFNRKGEVAPNRIIITVQPNEGILLDVAGKVPGIKLEVGRNEMNFSLRQSYHQDIPEAYQKLLLDAINGDRTLFVSAAETELSWKVLDPFLEGVEPFLYRKGKMPFKEGFEGS
jgi:glucose-6-phosphate 1-dehydrogenase